eukprot:4245478-Lingulodinium_polyedra.AAC.1
MDSELSCVGASGPSSPLSSSWLSAPEEVEELEELESDTDSETLAAGWSASLASLASSPSALAA